MIFIRVDSKTKITHNFLGDFSPEWSAIFLHTMEKVDFFSQTNVLFLSVKIGNLRLQLGNFLEISGGFG